TFHVHLCQIEMAVDGSQQKRRASVRADFVQYRSVIDQCGGSSIVALTCRIQQRCEFAFRIASGTRWISRKVTASLTRLRLSRLRLARLRRGCLRLCGLWLFVGRRLRPPLCSGLVWLAALSGLLCASVLSA